MKKELLIEADWLLGNSWPVSEHDEKAMRRIETAYDLYVKEDSLEAEDELREAVAEGMERRLYCEDVGKPAWVMEQARWEEKGYERRDTVWIR